MSEPREIAEGAEQVADGLWHWSIRNSGIGGATSSSHAVASGAGCVLVDPVRLADDALAALPRPAAIALTARCHQRAAWRYRKQFGAEVWLPVDASTADEDPDRRYAEGNELPGGLTAIRTPGPEWPHYSFLFERGPGVLFCSDLIGAAAEPGPDGAAILEFIPPEYHEDPAETRRSVEKLLGLPFTILCLDHGAPLVDDPKAALRRLLESTA
jgi:glyoxylase-like metal-dependent hydrolase (beta-lactamase superfamily II)